MDKNETCTKHYHQLKISYNIAEGFFDFKEDLVNENTIEGMAIESYIEKYKLSLQWIDEGGFWGSKDENGTFNGVVGRVS